MDAHREDITKLYRELAVYAASTVPPALDLEPTRAQVLAMIEDLQGLAVKVDAIVEAYAEYVDDYAGYTIAKQYKAEQLQGALHGNLFYEIELAAAYVGEPPEPVSQTSQKG